MTVFEQAGALEAMGTRGISTEMIEDLLEQISHELDLVQLGDQATWDRLDELRIKWATKLNKLQAYLNL